MLEYGVFFPLGGLSYLPGITTNPDGTQKTFGTQLQDSNNWDVSSAQTVRLFLGVAY
jgi:hypothetical protein